MEASRISFPSAIVVALTLCLSTLCLSCGSQRTMATIPAGPQLTPRSTPASPSIAQPGKVR
jgi:hypothetical protein